MEIQLQGVVFYSILVSFYFFSNRALNFLFSLSIKSVYQLYVKRWGI